jgi:hypothetical protein
MTKAYNYEVTVMESARNLSQREKAGTAAQLVKKLQSGIGPRPGSPCSCCGRRIERRRGPNEPVVCFE